MAATVSTFMAHSVFMPSSSVLKITVAATGPNTVTLWSVALTNWRRHYLAASAGAGTSHDAPKEAGSELETLLNASIAGWDVRMRSDGRWEITNTTGTWSVLWDGTSSTDKKARDFFGFASNITSIAAGTYVAADYPPYGALLAISKSGDTFWNPQQTIASAPREDGDVEAIRSGYLRGDRSFDLRFHPHDATTRAADGHPHSPFYPAQGTRWLTPGTGDLGSLTSPYSVLEWVMCAPGQRVGAALGTFQDHYLATTTTYDLCALNPEFAKRRDWSRPSEESNARLRDVRGFTLSYVGAGTRS